MVEFLCIVNIVLLLAVIVLLLRKQQKSDISEIISVLKKTSEEQTRSIQKQIGDGATEQFERFGVISKSIQDTLSANRAELNRSFGI